MTTIHKSIVGTERLFEQKIRLRKMKALQNQIDSIAHDLENPKAIQLSDMPKSQNPFDRTTYLLSKKMELEKELEKHSKIFRSEEIILLDVIDKFQSIQESVYGPSNFILQEILKYHFLEDCTMKETNKRLNSHREDFEEKEENLLRNLYKWSAKALKLFTKCQKSS